MHVLCMYYYALYALYALYVLHVYVLHVYVLHACTICMYMYYIQLYLYIYIRHLTCDMGNLLQLMSQEQDITGPIGEKDQYNSRTTNDTYTGVIEKQEVNEKHIPTSN